MGFAHPNPLLTLTGCLRGMYIAKYGDKYVVKKRPERKPRPATTEQQPVRAELVKANEYWKVVKQLPELKAFYDLAAARLGKRAIDLAKADFLHSPTIEDIDLSGYTGQPGETICV